MLPQVPWPVKSLSLGEHFRSARVSTIIAMRTFVHVITDQHLDGHWTAWFSGTPQRACGGHLPVVAVLRLLSLCSEGEFDPEGIVAVPDATRQGHLEFLIPHRYRLRIPMPSVN
jgi:hypothetical protein